MGHHQTTAGHRPIAQQILLSVSTVETTDSREVVGNLAVAAEGIPTLATTGVLPPPTSSQTHRRLRDEAPQTSRQACHPHRPRLLLP